MISNIDLEFGTAVIKAIYSDGRIDSLEKFCEKIPFMRMELKDDRMCKCSWIMIFSKF